MSYTYKFPKPSVTLDPVVLHLNEKNQLLVLLIQRKKDPFGGRWALPGGFLEIEEDLLSGALRELKEETGLELDRMEQMAAFGTPGRDPRGRTISVVYFRILTGTIEGDLKADTDAAAVNWFDLRDLPELAFDHNEVLGSARLYLYERLRLAQLDGKSYENLSDEQVKTLFEILK